MPFRRLIAGGHVDAASRSSSWGSGASPTIAATSRGRARQGRDAGVRRRGAVVARCTLAGCCWRTRCAAAPASSASISTASTRASAPGVSAPNPDGSRRRARRGPGRGRRRRRARRPLRPHGAVPGARSRRPHRAPRGAAVAVVRRGLAEARASEPVRARRPRRHRRRHPRTATANVRVEGDRIAAVGAEFAPAPARHESSKPTAAC